MIYALISILLNSIAQLTLKKVAVEYKTIRDLFFNPFLYLSAVLYIFSIGSWLFALKRIEVSLAFPLQSLGYVIVFFSGIWLYNEQGNWLSIFALTLIVIGAVTLGFSKL